jgi:hypothetical protein
MDAEKKFIKDNIDKITDGKIINEIYKNIKLHTELTDDNKKKYDITLSLANKILEAINKQPITKLTDFIKVNCKEIPKEKINEIVVDMENTFFGPFDKVKLGWYYKNDKQNYLLTLLRAMCKDCNLEFSQSQKSKIINGERTYHQVHTISSK